jgi:hypothetical protein
MVRKNKDIHASETERSIFCVQSDEAVIRCLLRVTLTIFSENRLCIPFLCH